MRRLRLVLALAPIICFVNGSPPVFAANLLEEIVVTATRTEKVIQNSPYAVSVITEDELNFKPEDQLAELMRDLPGIYVSDAGQAGQLRLRIRGEEARRMAMLVDGQEFGDHREVGVPLLIDPAEIERIELVRGPASVLYGPKAMGGVVNIITRSRVEQPFTGRISTAVDSATDGVRLTASMGGVNSHFDWRFGYTNNDQGDRDTPAGTMENTSHESESYSFSIGRVMESSELRFRYEDYDSSSEIFVEPEVRFKPPFVDFALDTPQRDREKLSVAYTYMPRSDYFDSIKIDAYRQVSQRIFNSFPSLMIAPGLRSDTEIITDSELTSDGLNMQFNFAPGDRQELVTGIQYVTDEVDQIRYRDNFINGIPRSSEVVTDKASLSTLAFYAQDEIGLSENISMLLGARYYQVDGELEESGRFESLPDFDDTELVKSIAFTYTPSETLTWRMSYSDGYIYPSLLNLAMGAFAGSRYVNPNPTLKPETSESVELGVRFSGGAFTLDTGLFLTKANDYIDHLFCVAADECLGGRDKVYKNVGEAETFGLELLASYNVGNSSFYSNVTWLQRQKEFEDFETSKSGVPQINGNVGWRLAMPWRQNSIEVDVFSRFADSADERTSETNVDHHSGWGTLNTNINLATPSHYKVALQLVNLTDKKYSGSTENLFAPGRSVRLLLSAEL
jgi:hemoglobin/transferrin/lactoferrin receptor protein